MHYGALILEIQAVTMHRLLRILGWLVMVGGSFTSMGIFWIDHMNDRLWITMFLGEARRLDLCAAGAGSSGHD